MSLALAVVAAPLIRIAYGKEFVEAVPVTLMLLPGAIAWASYQVSNQLVRIYGRPWQAILYTGAGEFESDAELRDRMAIPCDANRLAPLDSIEHLGEPPRGVRGGHGPPESD